MEPLVLTVDLAGLPQAWVDLEEAITDLYDSPVGWLLVHRPGWTPPATWAVDTHVGLEALDADTSAALARSLLGAAALFVPRTMGDLFMALGFGFVQIGFGIWIAQRHGG